MEGVELRGEPRREKPSSPLEELGHKTVSDRL